MVVSGESGQSHIDRPAAQQALLARLCLAVLVALYAVYFSAYQINRHRSLMTFIDLAAYEQPLWTSLHGNFAGYTLYPAVGRDVTDFSDRASSSRLGTHVQPTHLLLLPLYALWQRPETLLVAMCVAVALGAVPFYRLAMRRLSSPSEAMVMTVVYLLLPAVETANGADFHATSLALPLLLAALNAVEQGQIGWWWVWSLLAMGTREDLPLLVGWAMLCTVPRCLRRQALLMLVFGLCASALSFLVVIPYYGGAGTPFTGLLGSGVGGGVGLRPAIEYMARVGVRFIIYNLRLGLPLAFAYWLSPVAVLACLPTLLINCMGGKISMVVPARSHYSLPALPWLLWGSLDGLVRVRNWLRGTRWRRHGATFPLVVVLVCTAVSHAVEGYTHVSATAAWTARTGQSEQLSRVLRELPPDGALSVDMHLAPHVASRMVLRIFPDMRDVDWVLLNVWYGAYPYGVQPEVWRSLFGDPNWETVSAEQGLILLRRGTGPPQGLARAFATPDSGPRYHLDVLFGDSTAGLRLVSVAARELPRGGLNLCTDWRVEGTNQGLPWIAPDAATPETVRALHAALVFPEMFLQTAQPIRDCTAISAYPDGMDTRIKVAVRQGLDAVPVTVLGTGGPGMEVEAGARSVILGIDFP